MTIINDNNIDNYTLEKQLFFYNDNLNSIINNNNNIDNICNIITYEHLGSQIDNIIQHFNDISTVTVTGVTPKGVNSNHGNINNNRNMTAAHLIHFIIGHTQER